MRNGRLAAEFALKFTGPLSAPLAFAFFAALVLHPVRATVAQHMPRRLRWVGVLCAVTLLLLTLGVLGAAVALAVAQVSEELPQHVDRLGAVFEPVRSWVEKRGIGGSGSGKSILDGAAQGGVVALKAASGAITFLVLSVFFVVLMLAGVTFWGWAWGAVGALLAVPITVTTMMLCARIPALERVAVVLGGDAEQHT